MICACGQAAQVGPVCDACLVAAHLPLLPTPRPPRRRGKPGVIDEHGHLRYGRAVYGHAAGITFAAVIR